MTMTSGVRCEMFTLKVQEILVSSYILDIDGMGFTVEIASTNSQARYEMVDLVIKYFRRIGKAGEHLGNFIHLDVDQYESQDVICMY